MLVPVYSVEHAVNLKSQLAVMPRAAKFMEKQGIMLEFLPETVAAVRQELGPLNYKHLGLEVYSRIRKVEEGFTIWTVPNPPGASPAPPKSVTVYEPPKPTLPPGAEAYPQADEPSPTEEEEEEEEAEQEEEVEQEEAPPERPKKPANVKQAARPRPLMRRGIKLDPQQPPPDPDTDLVGGGKVTRVKPKPKES